MGPATVRPYVGHGITPILREVTVPKINWTLHFLHGIAHSRKILSAFCKRNTELDPLVIALYMHHTVTVRLLILLGDESYQPADNVDRRFFSSQFQ